eukprot:279047-Prorocentrum_lima.AAC.1
MADRREGYVPVRRTMTTRATALQRTLRGEGSSPEVRRGAGPFSRQAMMRQALGITGEEQDSRDP